MWEFLKSKERKERERVESLNIKIEEDRLNSICDIESKRLNDKLEEEVVEYNKNETIRVKDENGTCPKCQSKSVVDKISRLKGEINGQSFGSMTFGTGFSSGSIHGIMDTLEINKCNHCQNEWNKIEFKNCLSTSWESKIRYLGLSITNLKDYPNRNKPIYINSTIDFWSGTKLEVLSLIIKQAYLGQGEWGDDYIKTQIIELISGNEDILINKLGFIK